MAPEFSDADGFAHMVGILSDRYASMFKDAAPESGEHAPPEPSNNATVETGEVPCAEPAKSASAETEKPPRVVFVIGAGSSLWSSMPMWEDKKRVKEEIVNAAMLGFSNFKEEACIRLEKSLGPGARSGSDTDRMQTLVENVSTDALCSVACDIELSREKVLDKLGSLFQGPPDSDAGLPPQLAYELLAHLLKHGFADDIVTFNFDDLMSTAMANEFGPDEFDLITSSHAVADTRTGNGAGPRRPRVIQVHGSVSAKSTLRFTSDDTQTLSKPMKGVIWEALFQDGRPLHIVSLGYSWQDPDFASWIKLYSESIVSLTVVQRDSTPPPRLEQFAGDKSGPQLYVIAAEGIAANSSTPISIDHLMWAAWLSIRENMKNRDLPLQPAARHMILGYLFGPKLQEDGQLVDGKLRNEHTRVNRLGAEVLLHVIKCQGMVNASVMAHDLRIRRYRSSMGRSQDFEEIIDKTLKPGQYPEVRETLFSQAKFAVEFAQQFPGSLQFNTSMAGAKALVPSVRPDGKIRLHPVDGVRFLTEQIKLIQKAPEVEIVRGGDPRAEWMFRSHRALTSYPALVDHSKAVLSRKWTHLFLVAESGQWLIEQQRLFSSKESRKRLVLMINASLPSEEEWPRKSEVIDQNIATMLSGLQKVNLMVKCAKMAWWQHNRHLTLCFDESSGDMAAIFFQRPNKASRISPVFLEDALDCAEVFITFLTYVRRALERMALEKFLGEEHSLTSSCNNDFVESTLAASTAVNEALRRRAGDDHRARERLAALEDMIRDISARLAQQKGSAAVEPQQAGSKKATRKAGTVLSWFKK